ncbi:hypothetical protein F5Y19DRAFT_475964 [Xylariaceae sp. FL1651]|nr:hypothetical protein F5Y19DRAFT_475964 [Xylariaceae sp. FL1651]
MFISGSLYAAGEVHADKGAARWVVIVSIHLFAAIFSSTWAIGFRAFLIESLPSKTRSSASSLAQSSCWFANFVVALTTPIVIAKSTFGRTLENVETTYSEKQGLRKQALSTGRWQLPSKGFRLQAYQMSA